LSVFNKKNYDDAVLRKVRTFDWMLLNLCRPECLSDTFTYCTVSNNDACFRFCGKFLAVIFSLDGISARIRKLA